MGKKESSIKKLMSLESIAHQIICLRQASKLLSSTDKETNDVLYALVHMLPEGWQYPEITCARIDLEDMIVASENYKETEWIQSADIWAGQDKIGNLEILYLEEREELEEGPFLHEERSLLETVAMEIGAFLDHKRIEQAKLQQNRELELYASLLRHDLKNDVAVVIGNIEILRMVNPNPDEVLQEIIESTEAVCERMIGVLASFGKSAKMAQANIVKLLTKVAQQTTDVTPSLKIHLDFEEGSDKFRIPESKLLPMVFDNLFRNTVIHAGDSATIDVKLTKTKRMVEIIVSDDGPGISEEVRNILFEKGASTRGGGLGLHLSRIIIDTMGGSIELDDNYRDKGATFRIKLPLIV